MHLKTQGNLEGRGPNKDSGGMDSEVVLEGFLEERLDWPRRTVEFK